MSYTHEFNGWTCPSHMFDCDCPDLETHACNPYQRQDLMCTVPEHQVGRECSDENCLPSASPAAAQR